MTLEERRQQRKRFIVSIMLGTTFDLFAGVADAIRPICRFKAQLLCLRSARVMPRLLFTLNNSG
jgi:hypothetical protein